MAKKTIAQRVIGSITDAVKGIWQTVTDPDSRSKLGLNAGVNIDPLRAFRAESHARSLDCEISHAC